MTEYLNHTTAAHHGEERIIRMKKVMKMTERNEGSDSYVFWMSKTPEERVEAVETRTSLI